MKMKNTIMAFTAAFLCGCTAEKAVDEHLVVEGWIEEDGYPVVMVTSSVPSHSDMMDEESLRSHVLTLARVSVTCGTEKVFLTGQRNDNFYPPYIYTTTEIKGEAGKTYILDIKYGETLAHASTTIPTPQALNLATAVRNGDGTYAVNCSFNAQQGSHYKFFVKRTDKDVMFLSPYLSLVNGDERQGPVTVSLSRGQSFQYASGNEWFKPGDVVQIRFCTMDGESFEFWSGYEKTGLLSRNPIFPFATGIHSNIDGGYGCWCGYGARYYTVNCE